MTYFKESSGSDPKQSERLTALTASIQAPQIKTEQPTFAMLSHRAVLHSKILGALLFYSILLVFFIIAAPGFLTFSNAKVVLGGTSIMLIVSLGQALTIISGGFDLSVGGVVPLGAVAYGEFLQYRLPIGVAMGLTVLVGAAVGACNGTVVRLGINPLIATLATMSMAGGMAYVWSSGSTVAISLGAGFLGNNGPFELPYYVYVAVILDVSIQLILRRTVLGRRIYVVGGNSEAARLSGINVGLVRQSVYILSGGLAAVAGIMYASQLLGGTGSIGSTVALTSVAAVVLGGAALTGGTGGVPGTVLGVLILGTVVNGFAIMRVSPFFEEIISGLVLLVAVSIAKAQSYMSSRR